MSSAIDALGIDTDTELGTFTALAEIERLLLELRARERDAQHDDEFEATASNDRAITRPQDLPIPGSTGIYASLALRYRWLVTA